jgi:hypothetical protein
LSSNDRAMSLEAAPADRPMSPENMAAATVRFEWTLASNLRDLGADHPQSPGRP